MHAPRRIAFVTSRDYAELSDDDRLALAPLAERGMRAEPAVWTDAAVRWEEFDLIVCRSPWDYHLAPERFLAWLGAIEARALPLFNPAAVIRWNFEKTYLRQLDAAGVPVVPTAWIGRGDAVRLSEVLARRGWERAVVKPTLSASAHETWIVGGRAGAEDEERFRRILGSSGAMVQPFMDEIGSGGEWSLIFIEGRFSHAVVKRPRQGDFRVQSEHGGTAEAAVAPPWLVGQAERAVDAAPRPLLYARVDGVVRGGEFLLMELELFEPALYLGDDPAAPGRFADAVARLGSSDAR